jgi:hypothetical protein
MAVTTVTSVSVVSDGDDGDEGPLERDACQPGGRSSKTVPSGHRSPAQSDQGRI